MRPRSLGVVLALTFVVAMGCAEPATAVGVGGICAGTAGFGCNAGLRCELEADSCGNAAAAGTCVRIVQFCNGAYRPVCACGGKTFSNDCERARARARKAHDGPCR
jgi:hypothetical protein